MAMGTLYTHEWRIHSQHRSSTACDWRAAYFHQQLAHYSPIHHQQSRGYQPDLCHDGLRLPVRARDFAARLRICQISDISSGHVFVDFNGRPIWTSHSHICRPRTI